MTDPDNADRALEVAHSFWDFGDHSGFHAWVVFERRKRFSDRFEHIVAQLFVECRSCGCWATASDTRGLNSEMEKTYPERRLERLLKSAFNNFKSRFPSSCAEALAHFVMRS